MAKINKYSVQDLKVQFPNDSACTTFIFDALHSRKCSCSGEYRLLDGRRQFQCSKCRYQIAPTAGTIFHKSSTPLSLWFHAIFIFSNAKSGISAKEMERQLGVTYKCAYRILSQIRKALTQNNDLLSGKVEMDAAYFGGKGDAGKNNEKLSSVMKNKAPVITAISRGGNIRAKVAPNVTAKAIARFLEDNVRIKDTKLMTDAASTYVNVARGYNRHFVDHHRGEWKRGDVYINSVEAWFSHVKRSITGTYKVISRKHLQSYLDSFAFHYNNRGNDRQRFEVLLGTLLHA